MDAVFYGLDRRLDIHDWEKRKAARTFWPHPILRVTLMADNANREIEEYYRALIIMYCKEAEMWKRLYEECLRRNVV